MASDTEAIGGDIKFETGKCNFVIPYRCEILGGARKQTQPTRYQSP